MVKIIKGEIQNIRKDRKALQIENVWYNSFMPLKDDLVKGNMIELTYTEKGDFKNIKSINDLATTVKQKIQLQTTKSDNDIVASQLTSYSKDIWGKFIEKGVNVEFSWVVGNILNEYKRIKEYL